MLTKLDHIRMVIAILSTFLRNASHRMAMHIRKKSSASTTELKVWNSGPMRQQHNSEQLHLSRLSAVAQENNDQTLLHSAHVCHPVGALGL